MQFLAMASSALQYDTFDPDKKVFPADKQTMTVRSPNVDPGGSSDLDDPDDPKPERSNRPPACISEPSHIPPRDGQTGLSHYITRLPVLTVP